MASDSWTREYNEAAKLAEEVSVMMSDKAASDAHDEPESQRHFSTARRKITILLTRLDGLDSILSKLSPNQQLSEKELNRRKEMISNLRAKTKHMASAFNMSGYARNSLLGPEIQPVDAATTISGLDNQGVVSLQRHIMKEQDEGLGDLEKSVMGTKHIAFAVNEELDMQTGLIDNLDYQVEDTGSKLQRVTRSLANLNRRIKRSCSCLCLALSVAGIVILILLIWVLIKDL